MTDELLTDRDLTIAFNLGSLMQSISYKSPGTIGIIRVMPDELMYQILSRLLKESDRFPVEATPDEVANILARVEFHFRILDED